MRSGSVLTGIYKVLQGTRENVQFIGQMFVVIAFTSNGQARNPILKNKNTSSTLPCCCLSVIKLCLTLCDPMDCSMPGLPVPYYLMEFAQDHVYF